MRDALERCSEPGLTFTSPRLRGEVGARSAPGEGVQLSMELYPLTPTLSPQAGRGSAAGASRGKRSNGAGHA